MTTKFKDFTHYQIIYLQELQKSTTKTIPLTYRVKSSLERT